MFHRPPVLHRLFFAILPPPVRARQIAQATEWFDGARGLLAQHLHVTLFLLDDCPVFPARIAERLIDLGSRIAAAPFEIVLDLASGSERSVALRPRLKNEALAALHQELAALARAAGIAERENYRFSPHLRLGYRDGRPFSRRIAPVAWRAEEIVLIHSHVGRTRHDVLARWLLAGTNGGQLDLF